jgi:hypothetical protein
MPNSKRKCRECKEFKPVEDGKKHPIGWFCSDTCTSLFVVAAQNKATARKQAAAKREHREKDKAFKRETRERKEAMKGRQGNPGYYHDLKTVLHYYVKHVLRKGEPCYTCGKQQRFEDSGGAFHVGHYMPAGTVDPRRFMLENLRIQCYSCNSPKSGNQAEYRKRLTEEMGQDHVDWLECIVNHKSLEEQYPTIDSIKAEITRYRTAR